MTTYCVWFDNLLEELFAIEKVDFEQYEHFQKAVKEEKNVVHYLMADSLSEAYEAYRKMQVHVPALTVSHTLN